MIEQTETTHSQTVRLPDSLKRRLAYYCYTTGRTQAHVIRRGIELYMKVNASDRKVNASDLRNENANFGETPDS